MDGAKVWVRSSTAANEAITSPGNGFDELRLRGGIAEHVAEPFDH